MDCSRTPVRLSRATFNPRPSWDAAIMLRVLALGGGVQSTTLLLMSCRGELPRLDAAIFADTGWETRAVYEHLDRLTHRAAESGITIHRVSHGDLRSDTLAQASTRHREGKYQASLPLYVLNPDGSRG